VRTAFASQKIPQRSEPAVFYEVKREDMATKGINITDFRTQVPGALTPTKVSWEFPVIEASKRGGQKKLEWRILVRVVKEKPTDNGETKYTFLRVKDEYFDSKPMPDKVYGWIKVFKKHSDSPTWDKTVATIVKKGKNIGKKNQTNPFTQALRDALGKYNKQVESALETKKREPHQATLYPPMLVQLLGNQDINYTNLYVQRKLDGVRTVATIEKSSDDDDAEDRVVLYSRNKKEYLGKNYLRDKLLPILQYYRDTKGMDIYLDGETYKHNTTLQTLSGWMRKEESDDDPAKRMSLYVFDIFIPAKPELTYVERKELLDELFERFGGDAAPEILQVETYHTTSRDEIERYYEQFLDEKYEGAIIRKPDQSYEYSHKNYHSPNMLKMKPVFDDEFEIVSFSGGEGKGKAKGALMWQVKTENGDVFDVTPMGTIEGRIEMFKELGKKGDDGRTLFEKEYLGKMLTVKFDDLSEQDIPLRGRAVAIRDYE